MKALKKYRIELGLPSKKQLKKSVCCSKTSSLMANFIFLRKIIFDFIFSVTCNTTIVMLLLQIFVLNLFFE